MFGVFRGLLISVCLCGSFMSSDRAAFLRAIAEQPDDDLPRLVYADWLDEHGEPERAEFIRLQIELFNGSKTIDETWYDRAEVIATRVLELEAEFGLGWLGRFQNGEPVSDWYYERGFVRDIDAGPGDTFLTDGGALFESHPIESLRPGEVPIGD